MQHWVRAAQAGDETAWIFLYRQHQPWLYAKALSICGNSHAAKDTVQDTFLQAYLKLCQLKDPAAFPAWLKTILLRYCQGNTKRELFFTADHSFPDDDADFAEKDTRGNTDLYLLQTRMHQAVASLSEVLQTVVLLRYFSGWQSYEQIAGILQIPVGTVRSRLNQARQKMTEHWKISNDGNDRSFREAGEWNDLYHYYFGNVHSSLSCRGKLLSHFDRNLELIFTSGKSAFGRKLIEKEIEDDIFYGNRFGRLEVMSGGRISIVEVDNLNPDEYPQRCPQSSIFVLCRNRNKITRLILHHSR